MNPDKFALSGSSLDFSIIKGVYRGKVRDVYDLGDKVLMVASDRISAFDQILPRAIPYKGQVLNQIAQYFLKATANIVPNWFLESPDPNVSIGRKAESIKIEMVIRGYLSGHAWRTYKSGIRTLCGVELPIGMRENDKFPVPIITPTTKASAGHDQDISVEDILAQNIVSENDWQTLEKYARALFEKGSKMAEDRGLILVDTKYEFGKIGDDLILIDEIHTPDSSRYFYLEDYEYRQKNNVHQIQLSKEFVREWLIKHHFQGLDGQSVPVMTDKFVWEVSDKYIELYELITGNRFDKSDNANINDRLNENISKWMKQNY
ncbi:MAG: phosphoribosylaminoimidazolesuccinocarboxamide synthase [Saprospiraceae bacterium]|jgi:phosphoribosylaminoimidazole-succinocarboxamide synthase|nr:phosphoribosylaminoimidazolesuccinocarboxamide synthase [Saprospiraceae bacterium]